MMMGIFRALWQGRSHKYEDWGPQLYSRRDRQCAELREEKSQEHPLGTMSVPSKELQ